MTRARRLVAIGVAVLAACNEDLAAPGVCPQYCPSGTLSVIDTVLRTAISRDSAYGRPFGYQSPWTASLLLGATLPGRDSRPILRTGSIAPNVPVSTDTTSGTIVGVDSVELGLWITARNTRTRNLSIALYRLPIAIDSTTTFAALSQPFTDSLIRVVYVDSLIALPGNKNSITHDSVAVDTSGRFHLFLHFDSAQAPYVLADSGKLALGIRVQADTLAAVAFGASRLAGYGAAVTWWVKVDSLGAGIAHRVARPTGAPGFDSFVFDPPAPPLDGTLGVGGVPSMRSLLRVTLPRAIRDSSQIARATLEFLPSALPQGLVADSFGIVAQAVGADFGPKSPLDPVHVDTLRVYIGTLAPTDTVRIDVTNILRFWVGDTLVATSLALRQEPEGVDFSEIRFFSSSDSARGPRLHLTYTPVFPFGRP